MDAGSIRQQVLKLNKARSNLLLVVGFSAVNLLLAAVGANLHFLFSATFPEMVFYFFQGMAEEMNSNAVLAIGLAIALIGILGYFLCWLLGKRWRAFILVALIFFSIDCLLLRTEVFLWSSV